MKQSYKIILFAIAFLLNYRLAASNDPKLPTGFKAKTSNSISFTENKCQMHDQNSKSIWLFTLKKRGISYQL